MDHSSILQLHVQHHGGSLKRCDHGGGAARFGKGGAAAADASRALLAFAAMASVALLFLSSLSFSVGMGVGSPPVPYAASALPARLLAAAGSLATTRTALFALSNAILLLLAADCRRWFFSDAAADDDDDVADDDDACCESAGDVLVSKQHGRQHRHHLVAVAQRRAVRSSCVPYQRGCLEHRNSSGAASEAFTEPVMPAIPDSATAALEAPEEQQGLPATSPTPEELLLRRLGNGGDDAAVGLEAVGFEEPTCGTGQGLDELEIDELNKRFDEFIRSRRNKWIKEEACLQWHQA
jgi:hypothetical protein